MPTQSLLSERIGPPCSSQGRELPAPADIGGKYGLVNGNFHYGDPAAPGQTIFRTTPGCAGACKSAPGLFLDGGSYPGTGITAGLASLAVRAAD